MQALSDTAILPFAQVCIRVIQYAHILNIMQAVICRNDVVKCACFTTGSHCVATGQLLNAWVGRIVRIRQRHSLTI